MIVDKQVPSLTIMIPSTFDRQSMLVELIDCLKYQIDEFGLEGAVEIITDIDNKESNIGDKRQRMIEAAKGERVVFIDSDDWISNDYLEEIFLAFESNPDVVTFNGWLTKDGKDRENFQIATGLPYISIPLGNGLNEYLRFPNHLCIVKREIALKIGYRSMSFQEDYDYALRLRDSGLIKTSVHIQKDLYHYRYSSKK